MDKGKSLEQAYRELEEFIIRNDPKLKESSIDFQNNVIKTIGGVRYEVDILITINPNTNYESIFLVECKNWDAKKVNPKEVSYFGEKIDAFGANKGIIVGTKFTNSATNIIKRYPRVEILKVKNSFASSINFEDIVFELPDMRLCKVGFVPFGLDAKRKREIEKSLIVMPVQIPSIYGDMDLIEFANHTAELFLNQILFMQSHLKVGLNQFSLGIMVKTSGLNIGDIKEEYENIYVWFKLTIAKPEVIFQSDFDFDKKGRLFKKWFKLPFTKTIIQRTILQRFNELEITTDTKNEVKNVIIKYVPPIEILERIQRELNEVDSENLKECIFELNSRIK